MIKQEFAGKIIVWDDDMINYPDYNLSILDSDENIIWNMKQVISRPDTCTVLRFLNDDEMFFSTFNGWQVVFNVRTMEVASIHLGK